MQIFEAKKCAGEVAAIALSCVAPIHKLVDEAMEAVERAKQELLDQIRRDKMERQRKVFLEEARRKRVQKVEDLALACRFRAGKRYMEQLIFEQLGYAGLKTKIEDSRSYAHKVAQSMERKLLMARHEPLWELVPVVSAIMDEHRDLLLRIPEGR